MALHRSGVDRFANIAAAEVTLSAADALTFTQVLTGISLGVGVGIIIDEIDYYPTAVAIRELLAATDDLTMGWTTSTGVTELSDASDRRIIHAMRIQSLIVGAVVSLAHIKVPFVHQFFPPLIFASPSIHLAADTTGAAAASVIRSRLYFRYIELSAQEYLEIAETFQLTS